MISSYSEQIFEDEQDTLSVESRRCLGRVQAAADRMGELVDSLLILARASRGQLRRAPFDLTATAAYTLWHDIQADTVTMNGFPTTANIGNGRIYTFEMALGWRPLRGLSLAFAGIANDSRVTNPQPNIDMTSDSSLPNVADFSGRVGADYETRIAPSLDLRLSAAARYVGKSRLGIGPVLGERQGDWLDVTLGAEIDRGRHAWFLDITNLLDTAGNRFALGSPFTLVDGRQVTPMRPRTIRLGWQQRF